MATKGIKGGDPPVGNKITIDDLRGIDMASGIKMTDKNRLSSSADTKLLARLIDGAKKRNIDPYTVLAMAMQETRFGAKQPKMGDFAAENPLFLTQYYDKNGKLTNFTSDWVKDDKIEASLDILQEKFALAKRLGKNEEADIIQAWNGYGKLGTHMDETEGIKSWYGIPVSKTTPIDMSKNPVYGKRIVDVRDNIIKTNPELVKLVQDYGKEDTSAYFPGKSMQAPQKKEEGGLVNSTAMDPQKWFTLTDADKTAYLNSLPPDQRVAFVTSVDAYEQQQNTAAPPPTIRQLSPQITSSFAEQRKIATNAEIAAIQPGEEEIDPRVAANERAKKAISNAGDRLSSLASVAGTFVDMANMSDPENATPGMGALGKGLTGAAQGFAIGGPLGGLLGGAIGAVGGALSAGTQREAYEEQEQRRKKNLLTGLRIAPSIQEDGGIVGVDSEIEVPVQEEEGEVMIFPDGRLVDSMATKTHKEMNKGKGRDKDPVTDIIPSGTMILSNSKKRLINLAKIKDDIFTITRGYYSEEGNVPGETIYMGDIYGDKGKVTPAFLAKKIRKMHPMIDKPVEQYEIDTNNENRQRRAQLLRPIMEMQEKVYKKFEYEKPEKFETGGTPCSPGFYRPSKGSECIPTPKKYQSLSPDEQRVWKSKLSKAYREGTLLGKEFHSVTGTEQSKESKERDKEIQKSLNDQKRQAKNEAYNERHYWPTLETFGGDQKKLDRWKEKNGKAVAAQEAAEKKEAELERDKKERYRRRESIKDRRKNGSQYGVSDINAQVETFYKEGRTGYPCPQGFYRLEGSEQCIPKDGAWDIHMTEKEKAEWAKVKADEIAKIEARGGTVRPEGAIEDPATPEVATPINPPLVVRPGMKRTQISGVSPLPLQPITPLPPVVARPPVDATIKPIIRPPAKTEPPIEMEPPPEPPAVVQQPPAVVQQPPAVVQQPPAVVQQPPAVVQQPPAVVQQPPAVVQQPPAQGPGSVNWGVDGAPVLLPELPVTATRVPSNKIQRALTPFEQNARDMAIIPPAPLPINNSKFNKIEGNIDANKVGVDAAYNEQLGEAANLYRSQRFRNLAIFASRLGGTLLQNPNTTPESLGTEHVDSMFPTVTESQIESQITPIRQSQNRVLSQVNDSGISGTRIGSAIASTQARLLDTEGDVRNKALTINQSQKAKRFGELQKILDANRNAVIGAENATRNNRNSLISQTGEIGADALKADGGLKEALSARMQELAKWRQESNSTLTQNQFDNLAKKEASQIKREFDSKMKAGMIEMIDAYFKVG